MAGRLAEMEYGKRKHKSIGSALHHFVWGPEVEFGDCVFYTVLTEVLLGLVWLFTLERVGINVRYSFIVWAVLVFLIWREYRKYHPKEKGIKNGNG